MADKYLRGMPADSAMRGPGMGQSSACLLKKTIALSAYSPVTEIIMAANKPYVYKYIPNLPFVKSGHCLKENISERDPQWPFCRS